MTDKRKPVRAVLRAAAVIQSIGARSKGISTIAADLGVSKGTVFDIIKTLESVDFVRQDTASEEYVLGPAFLRLASASFSHVDVVATAARHLQELSDATGEITHLGRRDGYSTVYLHRAKSQSANRMLDLNSLLGAHSPLHCTSMGKIFLAHMSEEDFDTFTKQPLQRFTDATICDARALHEERLKVLRQGYALNIGEYESGVSSVAVALKTTAGPVTMGINFAMPSVRLPQAEIPRFVSSLQDTATAIERKLGQ